MGRRVNPDKTWLWVAGAAAMLGGAWWYFGRKTKVTPKKKTKLQPKPGQLPPSTKPDLCDPVDATTWPSGKLCVHDGERFVYVDADAPAPVPQLCDPLNASTWPPGKLCVHDGERFVLVDAEPAPAPQPSPRVVVNCVANVTDDHGSVVEGDEVIYWGHRGLPAGERLKLTEAVSRNQPVFVRLNSARRWEDFLDHEHGISLSTEHIALLRAGGTAAVQTSLDKDHRHLVYVSCETE